MASLCTSIYQGVPTLLVSLTQLGKRSRFIKAVVKDRTVKPTDLPRIKENNAGLYSNFRLFTYSTGKKSQIKRLQYILMITNVVQIARRLILELRSNQRAFREKLHIHRLLTTAPPACQNCCFLTISSQFFAIYTNIFHKSFLSEAVEASRCYFF